MAVGGVGVDAPPGASVAVVDLADVPAGCLHRRAVLGEAQLCFGKGQSAGPGHQKVVAEKQTVHYEVMHDLIGEARAILGVRD